MLALLTNAYKFYGIAKVIFDMLLAAYQNPELRKLLDGLLAELKKLSPGDREAMLRDADPQGPVRKFIDTLRAMFHWSVTPWEARSPEASR